MAEENSSYQLIGQKGVLQGCWRDQSACADACDLPPAGLGAGIRKIDPGEETSLGTGPARAVYAPASSCISCLLDRQ